MRKESLGLKMSHSEDRWNVYVFISFLCWWIILSGMFYVVRRLFLFIWTRHIYNAL